MLNLTECAVRGKVHAGRDIDCGDLRNAGFRYRRLCDAVILYLRAVVGREPRCSSVRNRGHRQR